jgi:hypothetical protein
LKAIKKGAVVKEVVKDVFCDISFSDSSSSDEEMRSIGDESDEYVDSEVWTENVSDIQIPEFSHNSGPTDVLDSHKNELDFCFS